MIKSEITDQKSKNEGWGYHMGIAIDQLGNAIAGGHSDLTVSSRVGYVNYKYKDDAYKIWKYYQRIIDFAWSPKDGKHHCHYAYRSDVGDENRPPNEKAVKVLYPLVALGCLIMGANYRFKRRFSGLKPKNQIVKQTEITRRSFDKIGRIQNHLLEQISIEKWDLDIDSKKDIESQLQRRRDELDKIEKHLKKQNWVEVKLEENNSIE